MSEPTVRMLAIVAITVGIYGALVATGALRIEWAGSRVQADRAEPLPTPTAITGSDTRRPASGR